MIDSSMAKLPLVGILMGSDSDWPVMSAAAEVLRWADVPCQINVVSAHRQPEKMLAYAQAAREKGLKVLIAGAGGAAHLPGMVASATSLPVIGVPVPLKHLSGLDSLLSIVQMPAGVPVACVGIGGAKNAGLLALRILSGEYPELAKKLLVYQQDMFAESEEKDKALQQKILFGDDLHLQ